MYHNTETGRYEFERDGHIFGISAEVRESLIAMYMSNQDSDAWDDAPALRAEAEAYVDQPAGWTDQEIAELELHTRWTRNP